MVPGPKVPRVTRALRSAAFATVLPALLLATFATPAFGQGHDRTHRDVRSDSPVASPYLPIDHWAYPVLELWISRGDVTTLSPMTRPYRIADVVRAASQLRDSSLSDTEAEIRRRLLRELGPVHERRGARPPGTRGARAENDVARLELIAEAGGRYVTQTHPDPLQAVLDGEFGDGHLFEGIEVGVRGAAPYVAGAATLRHDGIYRNDPRFPDGRVTPPRDGPFLDENLSLRLTEAYVEFQVPFARLSFGRLDREWGPPTIHGFVRSANPYSQDEIGYRFGTERVFLIGSISAPGDFGGDTVRHLSMHRLEIRPSDRLAFAVSEAALHGGPDGRFRFELANPVGIWQLALDDEDVAYNKVGQFDAWWRPVDGVAVNGSLLADATGGGQSCCQMGGSLGLELTRLFRGVRLAAQASALQSLVYRTARPWEEYTVDGVGLGWDKTDLQLFTLEADWFLRADLRLGTRIDVQRRGEGDFGSLRPPDLSDQPTILSGVVETTVRPAIAGRFAPELKWPLFVEWDLGLSIVSDYAHVEGDDRTEFTGSLGVRLRTPRNVFHVP